VSRSLSLAILVLAVLAVLTGIQLTRTDDSSDVGCSSVRRAYERVAFVERSHDVPTTKVYEDVAITIRKAAATAPPTVVQDVARLGDAYVRIGNLLRGFDPAVEASYHVYEDNTAAIEQQQTVVDATLPPIREWLDTRCA
jgi:hypothetical protein